MPGEMGIRMEPLSNTVSKNLLQECDYFFFMQVYCDPQHC